MYRDEGSGTRGDLLFYLGMVYIHGYGIDIYEHGGCSRVDDHIGGSCEGHGGGYDFIPFSYPGCD